MNEKLNPMEILTAMENVLDKLAEAQGRARCGYVWILSEFVNNLREQLAPMMQAQEEASTEPVAESSEEKAENE